MVYPGQSGGAGSRMVSAEDRAPDQGNGVTGLGRMHPK